ncbi:MAG: LemA family protein [Candidatus Margulisbacteria bacterium]|nr:LemA family protein [Candidatus Margulisiibacteriota bacterium]
MKKNNWLLVLGIILAVVVVGILSYINVYNSLVRMDESINTQWSQVENQMQRRYDLIPNLISTVKGYATHEKEIFENIAASRAKLAGAKTINDKVNASNGMENAISRLLVVVEQYPNLKANESFTRLMDELAGAENRLAVERMRYNELVKDLNIKIRNFPVSLFAKQMGFEKKDLFKVQEKAKEVPKVEFNK